MPVIHPHNLEQIDHVPAVNRSDVIDEGDDVICFPGAERGGWGQGRMGLAEVGVFAVRVPKKGPLGVYQRIVEGLDEVKGRVALSTGG